MIISRSVLLTMRKVSDDICRENQTHILWSIPFFCGEGESCCLRDNMEKYCRAGLVTDNNMAHAHCMLED